ncbi:MAG: hypothetical protein WKF30_09045 [Pyrinomonadaceae bacterium]
MQTIDSTIMSVPPADNALPDVEADRRPPVQTPSGGRSRNGRASRTGRWVETLQSSDVNQLWADLHQMVSHHPLVRASHSAGLLVEEGSRGSAYMDLTQELFVTLLSKKRFQHYLETEMTDAEIECEIGQIELTNLLTTELRKRHPESYRLARRISTIIQASVNFRRFDGGGSDEPYHRRLAERVYGLQQWPLDKAQRPTHELEQLVRNTISVRQRDTRMVGCTGDAHVIIGNTELEELIVAVLEVVDAPVDMRSLRSLVMSRLPVMDIYLVPLGNDNPDCGPRIEPIDGNDNPEQGLLRRESEDEAVGLVDDFLKTLSAAVRDKTKQYERMLGVLWYCYLCRTT